MSISIPKSFVKEQPVPGEAPASFITGPDVFTPADDTLPLLTPAIREAAKLGDGPLKVADFGAGSGQLGLGFKLAYPNADVTLYEIDPKAEDYIKANIEHVGLAADAVTVVIGDVASISGNKKFDVILSSGNYVPEALKDYPSIGYVHENDPADTVYAADNGYAVQKVFISKAFSTLKSGGMLFHISTKLQKEEVQTILADAGFINLAYEVDPDSTSISPIVDPGFHIAVKP